MNASEPSIAVSTPPEGPAPPTIPNEGEMDRNAMSVDSPASAKPPQGPIEVIDVDEERTPPLDFSQAPPVRMPLPEAPQRSIDIPFEASKLPLDVAVFNSARAAGGDDKIRKYLQAVLVIGGTALVPGMAHALESRYGTPMLNRICQIAHLP